MLFDTLHFLAEQSGYTVYKKQKRRSWIVVISPSGSKLYFRSYQDVAKHIRLENEYFDRMLADREIEHYDE